MLTSLKIQNYALIEKLEIAFNSGFSTITGETGAGKSIVLGALSLLVGQRADTSVLKDKEQKSVAEASFSISEYNLKDFFADNDVDYEHHTVIRREILPNGKSRAFVNDTPVNLDFLKDLGEKLIDIHSQHQNQLLNSNEFQLAIVDGTAGLIRDVEHYNQTFREYKKLQTDRALVMQQSEHAQKELSYKVFLFEELDTTKLVPGELKEVEIELEKLSHTEELKESYSLAYSLFNDENANVLSYLKTLTTTLKKTAAFYKPSVEIAARIESSYIELKDIAMEVSTQNNSIEANPERLQFLSQRLDTLYALQQKHHVTSVEELIAIREMLRAFVEKTYSFEHEIAELKQKIDELHMRLNKVSDALNEKRKNAAKPLSSRIAEMLKQLGMPNISFHIDVRRTSDLRQNGSCEVVFMFSANKNAPMQPITDIASGGELSRIMLCLKVEISGAKALPTIVFDEIDTGVSGDIAHKMGEIMKQLSQNIQVICITHLPQIAAKGTEQYIVYKEDNALQTVTNIKKLTNHERVTEIAKMLSGQNLTDAAIQNAKELLNS